MERLTIRDKEPDYCEHCHAIMDEEKCDVQRKNM